MGVRHIEFLEIKNHAEHIEEWQQILDLYELSFPKDERRRKSEMLEMIKYSDFHCISAWQSSLFLGFLSYWDIGEFKYVEHFAINNRLRGRSGTRRMLKAFCKSSGKIILETEPPIDDISVDKLVFLESIEFKVNFYPHMHPPFHKNGKEYELVIMSYPQELSREDYERFSEFQKEVMRRYI